MSHASSVSRAPYRLTSCFLAAHVALVGGSFLLMPAETEPCGILTFVIWVSAVAAAVLLFARVWMAIGGPTWWLRPLVASCIGAALIELMPLAFELLGLGGHPGHHLLLSAGIAWWIIVLLVGSWTVQAWPVTSPARRLRLYGARACLVVVSLIGTLLLADILVSPLLPARLQHIEPTDGVGDSIFEPDPLLGRRGRPGARGRTVHVEYPGQSIALNAQGFRDHPWDDGPGEEEAHRIVFVGDSFLFGTGVEAHQVINRQLENLLSGDGPLQTFNLGIPGYGPVEEAFVLRQHVASLRPQGVVSLIYLGNDLQDTLRYVRRLDSVGHSSRLDPITQEWLRERQGRAGDTIRQALQPQGRWHGGDVWNLVTTGRYWQVSSNLFGRLAPSISELLVNLDLSPASAVYNAFLVESTRREPSRGVRAAIESLGDTLERTKRRCEDRGIRFVVVVIPALFQVDRTMFDGFFEDHEALDREEHTPENPTSLVIQELEARDILYLDALPELRRLHESGRPPYHGEGHWNALGHRVGAEQLAAFLRSAGWL